MLIGHTVQVLDLRPFGRGRVLLRQERRRGRRRRGLDLHGRALGHGQTVDPEGLRAALGGVADEDDGGNARQIRHVPIEPRFGHGPVDILVVNQDGQALLGIHVERPLVPADLAGQAQVLALEGGKVARRGRIEFARGVGRVAGQVGRVDRAADQGVAVGRHHAPERTVTVDLGVLGLGPVLVNPELDFAGEVGVAEFPDRPCRRDRF